jgi:Arc/MetJ-type ribon-helix-helix transcriptional regulator
MTIHLPPELERFVHDQVVAGRYPSEDAVVCDALERLRSHTPIARPGPGSIGAMGDDADLLDQVPQDIMDSRRSADPASGQGLIGALRDDAEILDQAVEHAMKVREERPWRLAPGE